MAATFKYKYDEIRAFNESAECFVKKKSEKAYLSFRKVIELCLEMEHYTKIIELCPKYGYFCEKAFNDTSKSEEYYNQADELRCRYNLPHTCVITSFDPNEYEKRVHEAQDLHFKV
ncbi:hypothetical protein RF11_11451 [Thelohanellus kitauei]|uniref:Uncharacterized protein n=1 Tax=Thelohanellus kitauei TaxID=669202 RepID=A0A0C2NBX8_THEKT|nr:hypothetical protein RF11_11451 [Thelohanellus kitauei]